MQVKYWDKKEKKWLDPYFVCLWQGRPQLLEPGATSVNSYDSTYNPIQFEEDNLGGPYYDENIVAVREMGINDDNGTGIYEGDILQRDGYTWGYRDGSDLIPNVISGENILMKRTDIIVAKFTVSDNEVRFNMAKESNYAERTNPATYKIIGNIYEHPELISNKTLYEQ